MTKNLGTAIQFGVDLVFLAMLALAISQLTSSAFIWWFLGLFGVIHLLCTFRR